MISNAVLNVRIEGVGAVTPTRGVTSDELDHVQGRPIGWLRENCGVISRQVVTDESTAGMAAEACRLALENAGLRVDAVDAVIHASAVPEQPIPATAPLVQRMLGLSERAVPAFDINASCLSFLTALDLASSWIAAGRANRVIVASSEIASRALPWDDDPGTAGLFGDGAAAVVVGASEPKAGSRILATRMETWSEGYELCQIQSGGTRFDYRRERAAFDAGAVFRMDGPPLYRITLKKIGPFLDNLLKAAGWRKEDVDIIVPHQASKGALEHLKRRLALDPGRVVDIFETHGNQIAASMPSALSAAVADDRIKRGSKVLMVGTSAGLSLGGMALVF
jgi:3-oxoacyl-[acyl-carrier-protein] synthase III